MQSSHRLCLAPMLDWTDTHFRFFIRLLSPHCFLYTEMITTGALLHNKPERFLNFHPDEHPLALQLGGSDPVALAQCARLAHDFGYDEVNLNVGCPSDRVQSGRFGACLMKEPDLVADCVAAMRESFSSSEQRPLISVKCRLGVDDQDEFILLQRFIDKMRKAGCDHVIIHARNAWLKGLSPKENRDIPPLNYPWVYELKRSFSDLNIVINGGIKTVPDALEHLRHVDGIMIGRSAYDNPYFFCELEQAVFAESLPDRTQLIRSYLPYIEEQLAMGVRLSALIRPILGLFNGLTGARQWRRCLSTRAHLPGANLSVIADALNYIPVL